MLQKPTMSFLIEYILKNPEEFGLSCMVSQKDLHITMHAPYVESSTGRIHYKVYIGRENYPAIIAQVTPFAGTSPLPSLNPYYPPFAVDHLKDILVSPVGKIVNGNRQINWSRYLPWRSLKESFLDTTFYTDVVKRIRKAPWDIITGSTNENKRESDLLSNYLAMTHDVCSLYKDLQLFELKLATLLKEGWIQLKAGFSHGDLWVQDILRSNDGQLCFLDWEWSSPSRPMGTDLFHLALSALEFGYRITTGEAITCLIWGKDQVETFFRRELCLLWDELQYSVKARYLSIITYLVFIQNRIWLQTPRTLPNNYLEVARALHTAIVSEDYVSPLYG
jgi:hypothetical protein